jgi:hypothetical protein
MSTCWKCGGAPLSWARSCEVCGGRRIVGSTTTFEEMEGFKRDYWRESVGQFSDPLRSRVGFIVPSIANPLLLCI